MYNKYNGSIRSNITINIEWRVVSSTRYTVEVR